MKILPACLVASVTAATLFAAARPLAANAAHPAPVADFTVYLDPPTGFVFVKLPDGWKFAGKTDPDRVGKRSANVVITLLESDAGAPEDEQLAVRSSVFQAP